MNHDLRVLADVDDLAKVVGIVALGLVIGLPCLVGALIHFVSKDRTDKKVAWIYLAVGLVCLLPCLWIVLLGIIGQ